MKQCLQIARFFREQEITPDHIVSSIATRAHTTAIMIADALQIDRSRIIVLEELYEASTRTLFNTIAAQDASTTRVLLVAHNPSISYVAEYLSKAEIGEMVPGGLCVLEFGIDTWQEVSAGNGQLRHYIRPDERP